MSLTETIRERLVEPERRRTVRLINPRAQLKLAGYLLFITLFFGVLVAFNSWSAYGKLFEGTLSTAPAPFKQDILDQTHSYLNISLVLLAAYVFVVLAVTIGYLHRLIGPTVAIERQLRAMLRGDYSARLSLRSGDDLYSDLANHVNDLANRLEMAARAKRPGA
jgi:hypothetical protein